MHQNSVLAFREHVRGRIAHDASVLEIGADGDPSTYCREAGNPPGWTTADLVSETGVWGASATILMPNEYEIPVPDGTYDVVFSAQVAEHVREVWTWMRELARVTKAGGQVITISPVSWTFHEAPYDCWRMYPEAMKALSESAGLTIEHAWWGSLEQKPSRRVYAGIGDDWARPEPRIVRDRFKRLIGWPMSVAYDMVTVARKPL